MKLIVHSILLLTWMECLICQNLPICSKDDFHYEYTACDRTRKRWRVAVPSEHCQGGVPDMPVRGKDCDFQCGEGEFLDLSHNEECERCAPGTYSLGGGVRIEDWTKLPDDFSSKVELFRSDTKDTSNSATMNCSRYAWTTRNKYISALSGECTASLIYTAVLVKPGSIKFSYQFTDSDAIFLFGVQDEKCQAQGDENLKRVSMTEDGEWRDFKMTLQSGLNQLSWRVIGVSQEKHSRKKPTLLSTVEVRGVAYTSECSKCPNGTSSGSGASECTPCPLNTYSHTGMVSCRPCPSEQFAEPGSSQCQAKLPCQAGDYFEFDSLCDSMNMTRPMYDWIKPKLCRDDLPSSVSLPESGKPVSCPPCNAGMHYANGSCKFCPATQFSDGHSGCKTCPASTAPDYGIFYQWWFSLPSNANLSFSCLSVNKDRGCSTKAGWAVASDHIHSGRGHADDAYLVMSITVGGFRGKEQFIDGRPITIAKITFQFELICSSDCSLIFLMQSDSQGTQVVQSFEGYTKRLGYSANITSVEPVTFTWAFTKLNVEKFDEELSSHSYTLKDDVARIYSVNITNTLTGGAVSCRHCPQGTIDLRCLPCPSGHYISNESQCVACPDETIVNEANPWGPEACRQCGHGLHSPDRSHCVTSCTFEGPNGLKYNFTDLAGATEVSGIRLFTASGTEHFHIFNVSLCGGSPNFPMVTCSNNVSQVTELNDTGSGTSQQRLFKDSEEISAVICRSTVIPPRNGVKELPMAAQPISIGDSLTMITVNESMANLRDLMARSGFPKLPKDSEDLDVHFLYSSERATPACLKGRTTVITLRCDSTQKGNGMMVLPPNCADGTCDGCEFHMMWKSKKACPVCFEESFEVVPGACINGIQEIRRIPPLHCIVNAGQKLVIGQKKCTILPLWLQGVIAGSVAAGFLMCVLAIVCWSRNRKLEYQYMKLVENSGKDGELPSAESCGMNEDEEEEDDEFDTVKFKESNKFMRKLRKGRNDSNGQFDSSFESIPFHEKTPLT